MSYGGYRRIYRDSSGRTFAEQHPVFGGIGGTNQGPVGGTASEEEMSYQGQFQMGYDDYQYGAYDEMGAQGMMLPAPAPQLMPAYPQQAPMLQANYPQQQQQRQPQRRPSGGKWQKTLLTGTSGALGSGAQFNVNIRPQFDFVAQDFTVTGAAASNHVVTSVIFGDFVVWNNAVGVPQATLLPNSFIRGLVKGAKLRGGLDIQVAGTTGTADTVTVTVIGLKPQTTC